jgi:SNF2 family DNA or RNA helicase
MSDIADRLKLPPQLPVTKQTVTLPAKDYKLAKELAKDFIAECHEGGAVVVSNVLSKMLRMQQIASGYCVVQDGPAEEKRVQELNTSKADALEDLLTDISPEASVAVFCVFVHDLDTVAGVAAKAKRSAFELSGRANQLDEWKKHPGAVIAVQIRAGAEGVDMTNANHAIYFSLPYSLAQYNQSKARLYRPGQTRPVHFCHLIAEGTIDEAMYKSLQRKRDVIDAIKDGTFDYGFVK